MNSDGSLAWMAGFLFEPIEESLAVDSNDQNVYIGAYLDPLNILKLQASDGAFVSAQIFSTIAGHNYHIIFQVLDDNLGYIFISKKSGTGFNNICKYLFASPSSAQCQQINNFSSFSYGHIKLNNNQYFLFGIEPASTYHLHFYKVTLGNTAVDWANKMLCASGTCTLGLSEAVLDSDGTKIYAFPTYGSTKYLYLVTFSVSDGSVLNLRYKSSIACSDSYGSAQAGNYLALTGSCSSLYLMLFNLNTSLFTVLNANLCDFNQVTMEPLSGRIVGVGCKSNEGYVTKFYPDSISAHPDFTPSAYTMNTISAGTDDVIAESGVTISLATTEPSSTQTFTNQTLTHATNPAAAYTSDIYFQTNIQLITTLENTYSEVLPDLTCSYSGSTLITFSIANYNGVIAPSWVQIISSTGLLKISTPIVSVDTTVTFYEIATITGISNTAQKLIQIKIINCAVSNCKKCTSISGATCETCDTNYILNSGVCNLPTSTSNTSVNSSIYSPAQEIKSISTAVTSISSSSAGLASLSSIVSGSSLSGFWLMMNQLQMLFFLLFTGAFIPDDIVEVIAGSKKFLFPFSSLPFQSIPSSKSILDWFSNDQPSMLCIINNY